MSKALGVGSSLRAESAAHADQMRGHPAVGGFREALGRVSQDGARVDAAMRRVSQGATVSNDQLIALQMLVYRYSLEVDVVSKLVDKATAAVKQTFQSQG